MARTHIGWLAVIVESVEGEYTLFDIFDQDGKYIANLKHLFLMTECFRRSYSLITTKLIA
jgi:hypothetical protein